MTEKVILYSPSCPGCEQLRQRLEQLGVLEKFKAIDVTSAEGLRIVKDLGIKNVPECIIVTKADKGMIARKCSEIEFNQLIEGK